MNERVMQLRVGVMVLATLLITGILVLLINEPRAIWPGASYNVFIRFDQAPNVTEYTPIRKSGILIGRVTHVVLDDGGVSIRAELDGDKRLRHNEVFCIVNTLFGDAVINVVPADDPNAPDTLIEDGEQLTGVVIPSPSQVIQKLDDKLALVIKNVTGAGNALGTASADLGEAARNVSSLLKDNEKQISTAVTRADEAFVAVRDLSTAASELLGNEQTRVRLAESITTLPDTLDSMGRTIKIAEATIRRFVDEPPEGGESRIDKIARNVDRFDLMMGDVEAFTKDLEFFGQQLRKRDGTLGKFIHDPGLYNRLTAAAKRIDEVSWQVKPILNDVRVFTDKIARHPETLGVRGALQRKPGIK